MAADRGCCVAPTRRDSAGQTPRFTWGRKLRSWPVSGGQRVTRRTTGTPSLTSKDVSRGAVLSRRPGCGDPWRRPGGCDKGLCAWHGGGLPGWRFTLPRASSCSFESPGVSLAGFPVVNRHDFSALRPRPVTHWRHGLHPVAHVPPSVDGR